MQSLQATLRIASKNILPQFSNINNSLCNNSEDEVSAFHDGFDSYCSTNCPKFEYSGTPLIWSPTGQNNMTVLTESKYDLKLPVHVYLEVSIDLTPRKNTTD